MTILLFFATSIMSIYLLVNYFMDQRYYFSFQESIQNNPTLNVTNFPIMFSINDKDGNRPANIKVKYCQRNAEDKYVFVENVQERVVEHDHAKHKPDHPGISQWQFT